MRRLMAVLILMGTMAAANAEDEIGFSYQTLQKAEVKEAMKLLLLSEETMMRGISPTALERFRNYCMIKAKNAKDKGLFEKCKTAYTTIIDNKEK